MSVATCAIGLGANLGDRARAVREAWDALGRAEGVEPVALSEPIMTRAVTRPGAPDQPDYINAAGVIETTLPPRSLMDLLLRIERAAGRDRAEEGRWGPRTLDLDLLLYGDRVVDEPGLTVPHPRMLGRRFVLEPLAQVAPDAVHPVAGRPIRALLDELDARSGVEPPDAPNL